MVIDVVFRVHIGECFGAYHARVVLSGTLIVFRIESCQRERLFRYLSPRNAVWSRVSLVSE